MNSRNRSTGNGLQEGRRNRPWKLSWEHTRRHRSGGSAPISCPVTTTFSGANPVWIAERELPRIVLYLVLRSAAYERSKSCSQLFRDCLSSTCLDWRGTSMPLLKPPEPQIAMRKFY